MTDQRSIDLSVEVPGTPEEVWAAIATGPGISSWFVPCEVAEHEGGEVTMDFGSFGKDTAVVTAWEPPHRFVCQGGGDRPLAYEWLVEARSGGTCVVRLVNTGFGPGADWDADFEGMSAGWKMFFQHLRLHLTEFRGQRARPVIPSATVPGPRAEAWASLCAAMGLSTDLVPGDRFETSGDGVPVLRGTIDHQLPMEYGLLLEAPVPGTGIMVAEGDDDVSLSVWLYLYGDNDVEAELSSFLAEHARARG